MIPATNKSTILIISLVTNEPSTIYASIAPSGSDNPDINVFLIAVLFDLVP